MKKYLLTTIFCLFLPVTKGMDWPPVSQDQHTILHNLEGVLVTEELYKLALEKIDAIKFISENKYLGNLFLSLIKGDKILSSTNGKYLKTLLEDPKCKTLLLQARHHFGQILKDCSLDNMQTLDKCLTRMISTLSSFDHSLVQKMTQFFYSFKRLNEIFQEEIELYEVYDQASQTKHNISFLELHNAATSAPRGFDALLDLREKLEQKTQDYSNRKLQYIIYYLEQIKKMPKCFHNQYIAKLKDTFNVMEYFGEQLGQEYLGKLKDNPSQEAMQKIVREADAKREENFLPQEVVAFEKKKRENQRKDKNKKRKARRRRRKKQSSVEVSPVITERQKKQTRRIKTPQERMLKNISSYYPGIKKIILYPHMVQFSDLADRTFMVYNTTGNTDYQELEKFKELALVPKLHSRVKRWERDTERAIEQVKKETGKDIKGTDRKDWIRKHQLPVSFLYFFRKMGVEKTFIDKEKNEIRSLYFIGRLKDGKYTKDGYFGLGFLPDEKTPTIYHACFEPKKFDAIMRDRELTRMQKQNLSLAFTIMREN